MFVTCMADVICMSKRPTASSSGPTTVCACVKSCKQMHVGVCNLLPSCDVIINLSGGSVKVNTSCVGGKEIAVVWRVRGNVIALTASAFVCVFALESADAGWPCFGSGASAFSFSNSCLSFSASCRTLSASSLARSACSLARSAYWLAASASFRALSASARARSASLFAIPASSAAWRYCSVAMLSAAFLCASAACNASGFGAFEPPLPPNV